VVALPGPEIHRAFAGLTLSFDCQRGAIFASRGALQPCSLDPMAGEDCGGLTPTLMAVCNSRGPDAVYRRLLALL
jgi:hypothetical protein